MNGLEKQKIIRILVTLEKCLNLNDHLQKLSVQKKIFFQRMLDDIMKDESPALDNCMILMGRKPNTFAQFIETLIKTKQNDNIDFFIIT